MKKRWIILISIIVLTLVIAIMFSWKSKEYINQIVYDLFNQNIEVTSPDQIDAIFDSLEEVPFADLDSTYLVYSKSKQAPYYKMLKDKTYYVLYKKDLERYIVGKRRIKDFVCKDKYYKQCVVGVKENVYWLIDKRVFYIFLDIDQMLDKLGYNKKALKTRTGHRHPRMNIGIGGASQSKHIVGEAVDLTVRDIDGNRRYEKKDKVIIITLLERYVGDKGGVGLYPGSTGLHYDVRGYRARWDSY